MADDVKLTIGAESGGLASEVGKVKQQLDSLKKKGHEAGGILEGDRRVENKMTAWVEGFKNAKTGADLLANTLGNLGDVFKTSLAIGVGLNVGAALIGMFSEAAKKAEELKVSAQEAADALVTAMHSGDGSTLEAAISGATAKIKELKAELASRWIHGTAQEAGQKEQLSILEEDRKKAHTALLGQKAMEIAIRDIKVAGNEQAALAAQEALNLTKEIAAIEAKGLPVEQRNSEVAVAQANAASISREREAKEAERLAKEKIKFNRQVIEDDIEWEKAGAESVAQFEKDKTEERKKSGEQDAQLAERYFTEYQEQLAKQEAGEKATKESIISFYIEKDKQYWAWFQGELDKQLEAKKKKELEITREIDIRQRAKDKAMGELEDAKREDIQQARDKAGALGLFKTGQSLPQQRAAKQFFDRQAEINAGQVARDEFRKKVGGDSDKLAKLKNEIEKRKQEILGDRRTPDEKMDEALKIADQIGKDIRILKNRLGVK